MLTSITSCFSPGAGMSAGATFNSCPVPGSQAARFCITGNCKSEACYSRSIEGMIALKSIGMNWQSLSFSSSHIIYASLSIAELISYDKIVQ
jgi:hypothetical protein